MTFVVMFEMLAYVSTTPRQREQFFQLYVLGSGGLAADYYPNDNPNILVGDQVHWYIGVTNFMGDVQLAEVRMKLGNQSTSPPDDVTVTPSKAPEITAFDRFLQDNETWQFPVSWSIAKAATTGNTTRITQITVGNQTINVNTSAQNGYNFRIMMELWALDPSSDTFQYGWTAASVHQAAWLQIWFNVTATPTT